MASVKEENVTMVKKIREGRTIDALELFTRD
jgi:hypothetical protein